MTNKQVRKDLREIRYYYNRLKEFNLAEDKIGESNIKQKAEKYNIVVRMAPPIFYDVYYGLYVNNFTQEALAYDLGVTPNYIYKVNRRLILFFQENVK